MHIPAWFLVLPLLAEFSQYQVVHTFSFSIPTKWTIFFFNFCNDGVCKPQFGLHLDTLEKNVIKVRICSFNIKYIRVQSIFAELVYNPLKSTLRKLYLEKSFVPENGLLNSKITTELCVLLWGSASSFTQKSRLGPNTCKMSIFQEPSFCKRGAAHARTH